MKILYSLALTLVSAMAANAQVANYALELEPKGHVDCGTMPEMEGLSSYTVQFWINPASWTEGASLISLGDQFGRTARQNRRDTVQVGRHIAFGLVGGTRPRQLGPVHLSV